MVRYELGINMTKKIVSFKATKKVSVPVEVKFKTKSGEQVSFGATKKVTKPVTVQFRAEDKK